MDPCRGVLWVPEPPPPPHFVDIYCICIYMPGTNVVNTRECASTIQAIPGLTRSSLCALGILDVPKCTELITTCTCYDEQASEIVFLYHICLSIADSHSQKYTIASASRGRGVYTLTPMAHPLPHSHKWPLWLKSSPPPCSILDPPMHKFRHLYRFHSLLCCKSQDWVIVAPFRFLFLVLSSHESLITYF